MWLLCALHLLLVVLLDASTASSQRQRDYCIVGAGPAGLQLAYYFGKAGRDYIIFERSNVSGNFFTTYPRHDQLISINKRYTGKTNDEFNLRHDWNSLLSDEIDLRFTKYSRKFFENRTVLVKYINDFKERFNLTVQYDTEIKQVTPINRNQERSFSLLDQRGDIYSCKTLIIATGLFTENIQNFSGSHLAIPYGMISTNPDDFEGKTVLILGRGNGAFETALKIYGSTNVIHMLSRNRIRLSWETHYVGDLRGVNNEVLDTYQLKSLDGLLEAPVSELSLHKLPNGRIKVNMTREMVFDNFALRDEYDIVISCLGFKFDFSIFNTSAEHPKTHPTIPKYPSIHHNYESQQVPGLFFAGTPTHSLDFRKSAGGFIHGFRYTARALHRLLEWRNHAVMWPVTVYPWTDMLNTILKRVNEASGTYQMFSTLGDIIILDDQKKEFAFMEEFPIKLLANITSYTGLLAQKVIVMTYEYGKDFSGPGKDNFRSSRATGEPSEAHLSNFLHPVLYYYETLPTDGEMIDLQPKEILPRPARIHHVVEDFLTGWDGPTSHILPLRRFLESSLSSDLRSYTAEECFEKALTSITVPLDCQQRYLSSQFM